MILSVKLLMNSREIIEFDIVVTNNIRGTFFRHIQPNHIGLIIESMKAIYFVGVEVVFCVERCISPLCLYLQLIHLLSISVLHGLTKGVWILRYRRIEPLLCGYLRRYRLLHLCQTTYAILAYQQLYFPPSRHCP